MATKKKSPNVGSPLTQAKRAVSSRPAKVVSQARDAAKQARTAQAKPAATKQTKTKTPMDIQDLVYARKYPNSNKFRSEVQKSYRVAEEGRPYWNENQKAFKGKPQEVEEQTFFGSPLNQPEIGIPMKGYDAEGGTEYMNTDGTRTRIHLTNRLAESSGVNHKIRRNQKKDEKKLYETSVARGLNTNDAFTRSGKRLKHAGKGSTYFAAQPTLFSLDKAGKAPYKDDLGLNEAYFSQKMNPEKFYGSTPNAVKPKKTTKKKK